MTRRFPLASAAMLIMGAEPRIVTRDTPEDVPEPDGCRVARVCEGGCYMFGPRTSARAQCMHACRMIDHGYASGPPVPKAAPTIPAKTRRRRARLAARAKLAGGTP